MIMVWGSGFGLRLADRNGANMAMMGGEKRDF
jgi:hypothetical protein